MLGGGEGLEFGEVGRGGAVKGSAGVRVDERGRRGGVRIGRVRVVAMERVDYVPAREREISVETKGKQRKEARRQRKDGTDGEER